MATLGTATAQRVPPSPTRGKLKKITISGRVTNEGAVIAASARRMWSIANSEVLREHVGEYVTVRGAIDPITRVVQVWSFRPAPPVAASARLGDAAFRR